MFDLEHLILFGLPENKMEWFGGRLDCTLPFATRAEAEGAFLRCAATLARWQGVNPAVEKNGGRWRMEAGGIKLELLARMLTADMPIYAEALIEFGDRFWQPSRWALPEGTPPGGGSNYGQYSEARMNISSYLTGLTRDRRRGWSSGGTVEVSLGDIANVQPGEFYFGPDRKGCLAETDYYVGAPDLIVDVLAPATAVWTRGMRANLYARAGVRYFWVVVPQTETLETWALHKGRYRLSDAYRPGDTFTHPLFPDEEINVERLLFRYRGDRFPSTNVPEPEPDYVSDPEQPIPLHNLLLGGHPARRYEVIDDRTPCIVAFESPAVARQRFRDWAEEIGRWDNTTVDSTVDRVRTARFDLRREGPRVALDVTTGLATYREILRTYFHNHDVWDEWHEARKQSDLDG